jgi:hypothetical protein
MTVCDLDCASSVVCAERFRTAAKSFTAGPRNPAVLRAGRGWLAGAKAAAQWSFCASPDSGTG